MIWPHVAQAPSLCSDVRTHRLGACATFPTAIILAMADLAAIWSEVLPGIRNGVTGVGVWSALNTVRPVAVDDGVLVMGLPHEESELAGHLRLACHLQ